MAEQTRTQRQAAGKKAAATRKRTAAKRSATATKSSARQTRRTATASARSTARSGRSTGKGAARTAGRQFEAATNRIEAVSRQVERVVLIQIGAAATVRDTLLQTAQTYADQGRRSGELNRLERRGDRLVRSSRRALVRRRREVEHDLNDLRTEAADTVERVATTL